MCKRKDKIGVINQKILEFSVEIVMHYIKIYILSLAEIHKLPSNKLMQWVLVASCKSRLLGNERE